MVERGEQERDAGLRGQLGGGLRRQADGHAERFEHVGRAAGRAGRAVAVLDHLDAGRGRDDRAHGGDVHRVRAVPAGADQVDQRAGHADRGGPAEHDIGQAGQLGGRLALHPQRHREPGHLDRGGRAVHDLVHRPGRLVRAERVTTDQRADQATPRHGRLHRRPFSCAGRAVQAWAGSWPFACCRISPASAAANGTGSIGWLVTASAPDQVASQPSSARPTTSSTGGQL